MHIVGASLVDSKEEEPAGVDKANQVDFESTKVGRNWCIEYPPDAADIELEEGQGFAGRKVGSMFGNSGRDKFSKID